MPAIIVDEVSNINDMKNAKEKRNVVIGFKPYKDADIIGHYIRGGQDLFKKEKSYLIFKTEPRTDTQNFDEDFDKMFALVGTSVKEFNEWMIDTQKRVRKALREKTATKDELFDKYAMIDPMHSTIAKENKMMHSLYQEIENTPYAPTHFVIAVKMSQEDIKAIKKGQQFIIDNKVSVGFFDGINGSGSLLEIEVDKERVIDINKFNGQIDIWDDDNTDRISIKEVYQVNSNLWKDVEIGYDLDKVLEKRERGKSIYYLGMTKKEIENILVGLDEAYLFYDQGPKKETTEYAQKRDAVTEITALFMELIESIEGEKGAIRLVSQKHEQLLEILEDAKYFCESKKEEYEIKGAENLAEQNDENAFMIKNIIKKIKELSNKRYAQKGAYEIEVDRLEQKGEFRPIDPKSGLPKGELHFDKNNELKKFTGVLALPEDVIYAIKDAGLYTIEGFPSNVYNKELLFENKIESDIIKRTIDIQLSKDGSELIGKNKHGVEIWGAKGYTVDKMFVPTTFWMSGRENRQIDNPRSKEEFLKIQNSNNNIKPMKTTETLEETIKQKI